MRSEKRKATKRAGDNDLPEQMHPPLLKKVVQGGLWIFSLRIINRSLGFIRTLILARLLSPEDFGLLGIAMLAISALETFSNTGFQAALIQKKDNVEIYLDTAWTVSLIRGGVLFILLYVSAPYIADFFQSPDAVFIIRVVALSAFLSGCKNIGMIYFQRELEFHKYFIYEFSAVISDLLVSVTLAFLLRNVWALVWGGMAANIVRVMLSYYLHPHHPGITFQKEKFQEIFRFGKWASASGILIFLATQGDDFFVGKIFGTAALGIYQMAYMLSNLATTEITHVISQVMFPAYAKIQDDGEQIKRNYLNVMQLTTALSFPLSAGFFILIPEFTAVFLTEKWMPVIVPVQILSVAGAVRSLAATVGPVLYSIGRPDIDTAWQFVRVITLALLLYPFSLGWGIAGVSAVVVISIGVSTVGFCVMLIRLTRIRAKEFLRLLMIPIMNSVFMAWMLYLLKKVFAGEGLWGFLLLGFAGIIIYFILIFLSDTFLNYGLVSMLKKNPDIGQNPEKGLEDTGNAKQA